MLTLIATDPAMTARLLKLVNSAYFGLQKPVADVARNLSRPIADMALPINTATRSGDTPASERRKMLRRPPEILITTPESLNLLLSTTPGQVAEQAQVLIHICGTDFHYPGYGAICEKLSWFLLIGLFLGGGGVGPTGGVCGPRGRGFCANARAAVAGGQCPARGAPGRAFGECGLGQRS